MRSLLLAATAAAAFTCATPAFAQDREAYDTQDDAADTAMDDRAEPMDRLGDRLTDPAEQERMAAMLGAMSEVLLDMPVGPLFRAMEQAGGVDAPEVDDDTTLREMTGADGANISAEISDKVPQMMGMLGQMTDAFAAMTPLLTHMAEQMRERVEPGEAE